MSRVLKALPWITLFAWLGALLFHLAGTINHDSAWYLYATGRWLDGARLYVDLVETNPPLVFYLHVPPVLLSRFARIALMPALVLVIHAMVLASIVLCLHLTRGVRRQEPHLWTVLVSGAFLISLVVPYGSFGQREHLAVVLCLGYLFASAVRASGHTVGPLAALVAGLLAGVGLSLKPYLLVVPLLLELREAVRERRISSAVRPDSVGLASVVLLYGLSVPVLHPEYLHDIVPMARATYDQGYGIPLGPFLVHRFTLMLLGTLAIYVFARPAMTYRKVTDTFSLAGAGFFGAYLWQMKGYSYHAGPVLALVFVALLPLAVDGRLVGDRGVFRRPQRLLAFIGVILIATLMLSGGRYPSSKGTPLYELIEREAPSSIAAFGPLGFPLVLEANVGWGSRFLVAWPVPGAWHRLHGSEVGPSPVEEGELNEIMDWTRRAIAEDLHQLRPELVLVDERPQDREFHPLDFDWLSWAAKDSLFAEEWPAYELIERLGPLAVYARDPWADGR